MNLTKIAQHFGTPLYVYDLSVIQTRIDELFATVGKYPNTKLLYAVKANFNPHIVREIASRGCGIDAVSVDEIKMGLLAGAAPQDILFTESNATDEEIDEAMRLGVLVNIGSLSRLKSLVCAIRETVYLFALIQM